MQIPKVPYLQYEILEYYYLNPQKSLSEYVDYPEAGNTVGNAVNKLIAKNLLTREYKLTDSSRALVEKYIHQRFNRSDYTNITLRNGFSKQHHLFDNHPNNHNGEVFRWYKYLEDFPHEFIRDSINKFKLSSKYYVLDPFTGSGTTQVQAKLDGFKNIGMDINPVMVFISKNKLNWNLNVSKLERLLNNLIFEMKNTSTEKQKSLSISSSLFHMQKRELNQWLSPIKQWEVAFMFYLIEKLSCESEIKELIRFIASTSALNASYVAFCPGTTFYPFRPKQDFLLEFAKLSTWVLEDLESKLVQKYKNIDSKVYEYSSKETRFVKEFSNKVDLIITSPPYPNDLEYTRQTRLELYMLGFVKNMKDVQDLKKKMVKGSTKLIYSDDYMRPEVKQMKSIVNLKNNITEKLKDKNWGFDYPKMVQQYFSDMWTCLENYHNVLVNDGTCILVVGDQTIGGNVISVAEILAEISHKIGFKHSKIELHRQRRSTTHSIPIPEENLILTK